MVKFGIWIRTYPLNDNENSKFSDQVTAFIRALEDSFNSVWIPDHFYPWRIKSNETQNLECWTTLSYLAGAFRKLDFGSIVLGAAYRNPGLVAKMGATLSALSDGRFILGMGAGWKGDEYLAYGYDFPSTSSRIKQLAEAVQIIKMMWTEDVVSFKGEYFRVIKARCNPKPDPCPPIMIGGSGEKLTLKVVARHADWWNISQPCTLGNYQHKLNVLKGHCTNVGRKYNDIKKTLGGLVAIAKTRKDAIKIASKSPFIDPTQMMDAHFVGTPDEVCLQLNDFINLGVNYFILRFLDFPNIEGATLFAQKVITEFK